MSNASVQSLFEQAVAHHQAGRLQQAESFYRQILAQIPNHPDALHHMGVLAHQVGNNTVALDLVTRAIAIQPNVPEYHNTLGEIHRTNRSADMAERSYHRAIELDPATALYQSNLCLALRTQRKLSQAIAAGRKAVEINPNSASSHLNLANALSDSDEYPAAIAHYEQAITLDPTSAQALTSLGATQSEIGRYDEAIECFDRAIALNDSPDAHFNRSFIHLFRGDFARGWDDFEWRWQASDFPSPRLVTSKPRWDGSAIPGKTLLLFAEQGAGDAIQFIRYAPMAAEQSGANIILVCKPEMKRLFESVAGISKVIGTNDPLPEFDYHVPLLSLPRIFQTNLQTIPAKVPYVPVQLDLVEQWKNRIGPSRLRRVGLVWQGQPTHTNDRKRSIALNLLRLVLAIEEIDWISLQFGFGTEQIAQSRDMQLLDLSAQVHDFADTAAIIANLDLVIGVDTAVVHLAAALGKPVWTMLPFVPEWRWMGDRADSPWYPTMRLFRQSAAGDWSGVVTQIAHALKE